MWHTPPPSTRRNLELRPPTPTHPATHLRVEHTARVSAVHDLVSVLLETDLVQGAADVGHGDVGERGCVTFCARQHTDLYSPSSGVLRAGKNVKTNKKRAKKNKTKPTKAKGEKGQGLASVPLGT